MRSQPAATLYASVVKEIGLFPLGLVLLPTEQVPLHIFEPRYRELVGECLDQERPFGLVHGDGEGIAEVGTEAGIVEVGQRYDDGRLDIAVEGGARFRLVRLTEGRSFQTAEIEPFEDEPAPAGAELIARALGLYDRLVGLTGAILPPPDPDDPQLSFVLAGRLELLPEAKLPLLGSRSEAERLARVCELLEAGAAELERRLALAERARGNGHAPH